MANHIYGIDFGTSNSVLAIANKETKEIKHVISEQSVIHFTESSQISIGKKAVEHYIQNNLKGRLLKSVKTLLPQASFTFTYIYGKKYTAEDLVCLLLKSLKKEADEYLGEEVTEVIMGRPVVFSEDPEKDKLAEKRLLAAAKKAGFEHIWFQYEPIGAGFLYEQSIEKPEVVLIGDFGGGTSDFTLMRLDRNNISLTDRKSQIINTGGIHIGGDDFDALIMWHKMVYYFGYGLKYESFGKMLDLPVHIYRNLCEWEQMAFLKEGKLRKSLDSYYLYTQRNPAIQRLMTFIDQNLGFSLFRKIEKAKIELSENSFADIHFSEAGIDIKEHLELNEFNEFAIKEVSKIEAFLTEFIEKSGIPHSEINNIFLTGGTSSLQAVRNIFTNKFSDEKIHRGDNFNSVAQGLALSYFYRN